MDLGPTYTVLRPGKCEAPLDKSPSAMLDLSQRNLTLHGHSYVRGLLGGDNPSRRSTHAENSSGRSSRSLRQTSPLAHAQTPSAATEDRLKTSERLSQTDRNALTDLRMDLVKGALQLTPEQQKYWPPVENAIRARAEDRRDRFAKIAETMGKRADESPAEVMGNRDPIAFLQRRAEALAQRSADLNKLAEAWQPLYKTLVPEQRQRMAALAVFVLHDMTDAVERRRLRLMMTRNRHRCDFRYR